MSLWGKIVGGAFGFMLGGPLGAVLGAALGHGFDKGLDAAGGMLGHGGIVVFDDSVDMAAQARFAMAFCAGESCGKCTPCRIGSTRGVEVIDDFAHNPDKIAASLAAARARADKVLAVFQPHGFGPTRFLRDDLARPFRFVVASSWHGSENCFFVLRRLFIRFRVDSRGVIEDIRDLLCALALGNVALAEDFEHDVALARSRRASGLTIDKDRNDAVGHRHAILRDAIECETGEVDPDRQGCTRAFLTRAEREVVVVTHPDHGSEVRVEAAKPGVASVIRGAGLARQVIAPQHQGPAAGAAPDDVAHHVLDEEYVLPRYGLRGEVYVGKQFRVGGRIRTIIRRDLSHFLQRHFVNNLVLEQRLGIVVRRALLAGDRRLGPLEGDPCGECGALTLVPLPGQDYQVTRIDPRTGERFDLGTIDGRPQAISLPEGEQVLLLQKDG